MTRDFIFRIVDVGHVNPVITVHFFDRRDFDLRVDFGPVPFGDGQVVHRQRVFCADVAAGDAIATQVTRTLNHALGIAHLLVKMAVVVHHRNVCTVEKVWIAAYSFGRQSASANFWRLIKGCTRQAHGTRDAIVIRCQQTDIIERLGPLRLLKDLGVGSQSNTGVDQASSAQPVTAENVNFLVEHDVVQAQWIVHLTLAGAGNEISCLAEDVFERVGERTWNPFFSPFQHANSISILESLRQTGSTD